VRGETKHLLEVALGVEAVQRAGSDERAEDVYQARPASFAKYIQFERPSTKLRSCCSEKLL
jgi:hypothetical protein